MTRWWWKTTCSAYNDSGGVDLEDSTTYGDVAPPMGRLYDVRVLRNKFDHIGLRPDLFSQGTALEVEYAQTAEVAGNIFDRICAQGVDVHGAKAGPRRHRPPVLPYSHPPQQSR